MSSIDFGILVLYVAGCTALGAWMGSGVKGLKGYFLGESNIPAWAVMISIVATETSTATFLSVPGIAFRPGGDFTYLQLALGYLVGRVVVATLLLPAYFKGEIFTAYQVLQRRFGGTTKTTASILFLITRTLGDGLRLFLAALVLRELTRLGYPHLDRCHGPCHDCLYLSWWDTRCHLDRRHPVFYLHSWRLRGALA